MKFIKANVDVLTVYMIISHQSLIKLYILTQGELLCVKDAGARTRKSFRASRENVHPSRFVSATALARTGKLNR
jgi:hypothetical protein